MEKNLMSAFSICIMYCCIINFRLRLVILSVEENVKPTVLPT